MRYALTTANEAEQKLVEDHSVLITRFLVVHRVADVYNPSGKDPMQYLPKHRVRPEQPSIWAWPELQQMWAAPTGTGTEIPEPERSLSSHEGMEGPTHGVWHLARFDQGCLGHSRRKPTAALTNS